MKRTIIILTVVLIGFGSCNNKQKKAEAEANQDVINSTVIKIGQQVPDFEYVSLNNDTFNINDLKGKVVFMNFFATSCPICIKELPFVEKDIWATYRDNENFELIVFGREHVAEEMIAFKEKNNYTFNIVPDPGRKIYSLFAEKYIPRNIVLNREGKIIYQATGFDDEEFIKLKETIATELTK